MDETAQVRADFVRLRTSVLLIKQSIPSSFLPSSALPWRLSGAARLQGPASCSYLLWPFQSSDGVMTAFLFFLLLSSSCWISNSEPCACWTRPSHLYWAGPGTGSGVDSTDRFFSRSHLVALHFGRAWPLMDRYTVRLLGRYLEISNGDSQLVQ